MIKRSHLAVFAFIVVAGCGGSGSSAPAPPAVGTDACSIDGQKKYVLDTMRDVYFWNDLLPANVDIGAYATPEELLADLISVQPLDNFSYIDSLAADAQFFSAGQYEGFRFSTTFAAPDDLRFVSVFASSPAAVAGFARGQQVVMLNGRTIADIEANEGVGELFAMTSLEFTIRRPDTSEFVVTVDASLVTIDPLPQWRIINLPGGTTVGYLELATFISTANAPFISIFAAFASAGVTDVILDLRYNGGGLVDTTELLGDFLGGIANDGQMFSRTLFNANNVVSNRSSLFQAPTNSVNLSRLIVIATDRTASASELITNSMFPYLDVSVVGGTTFGKPVGQLGLQFCDKILRATSFETRNANDEGGYFDGLPADCAVQDDLLTPVGAETDPNLEAALYLLENGSCPMVTATASDSQKPTTNDRVERFRRSGPSWRRLAGAW